MSIHLNCREDERNITKVPYNLPGEIYRGSMPTTKYDLPGWEKQLKDKKISTVVLLLTKDESENYLHLDLGKWYEDHHFNVVYLPIEDFSIPDDNSLENALNQMTALAQNGENVIVHCKGGIGRTGLVCSCLAKKLFDLKGDQAIRWVRKVVRGAVETPQQKNFVDKFGEKKVNANSPEALWANDFNTHLSTIQYPFKMSSNLSITSNMRERAMDACKVTLGTNEFIAAASFYYVFARSNFWNMMLQNNTNICVSLSDGYRLDEEYTKIDGGVVKCLSEENGFYGSVRREFEVRKLGEHGEILETKRFTQFDFPFWGKGELTDLQAIEIFTKKIKECQEKEYNSKGSITVHSEDGAGRTGTFIAAYQLLQDPHADLLTLVDDIRKQRPRRMMVETASQYIMLNQLKEIYLNNNKE